MTTFQPIHLTAFFMCIIHIKNCWRSFFFLYMSANQKMMGNIHSSKSNVGRKEFVIFTLSCSLFAKQRNPYSANLYICLMQAFLKHFFTLQLSLDLIFLLQSFSYSLKTVYFLSLSMFTISFLIVQLFSISK